MSDDADGREMSRHAIPGATDRMVRPPLAYPGNKARIAEEIIARLPPHDTYVEVFGGTAGVLFSKVPSRNEVINDRDEALYTFLDVLKRKPGELQEWLRAQPYSEHDYDEWHQRWHDGWRPRDDVVCAGVYFFLRRASFGADMGGFRAEANGRRFAPRQFSNAVDRLDQLSERLQNVLLLNRDFEAVVRKYGQQEDALLFLDPPYKDAVHRYKASLFDRGRFCKILADLEGGALSGGQSSTGADWIVSSATVPLPIRDYHTVELDCHHQIDNTDGTKQVTEKLTMNFDPEARATFAADDQAQASIDAFSTD